MLLLLRRLMVGGCLWCTMITWAHTQSFSLRLDWGAFFEQWNAQGTVVVVDARGTGRTVWVFDEGRARQRYSPASTFKIPHTLFALDAGVVRDEFQVFRWDRVVRAFPAHNQDQNLRSAMRNSAVWVFEGFAKKIGEHQAREYLQRLGYGNANPSVKQGNYWVEGELAISAHEQVEFLERLYKNQLKFSKEHQRLVKDIMIVEAGREWILRAKTGWSGEVGWWIGWVEWPTGPVFFALNIDTPHKMDDLHKREAIARSVLRSIWALPAHSH